jgi:sensor histidine kinase YesM
MKKYIIISLPLIYWGPKLLVLLFILTTSHNDQGISNPGFILPFSKVFPAFICFYIFYLYLFPIFLARKKIARFFIFGFITWMTLSILGLVILRNSSSDQITHNFSIVFWMMNISPGILVAGIVGSLSSGFVTWYSEIRVKEQLIQKNLQSELALLKAQINPHFLFNTINNIDVLIEKDPKAASKYLKQLSEIMRFMLYETSSDLIPLTTELEYITKYIDLQKIRTSNERFVALTISGDNNNLMIAPAVFIPFIENAFKHSTNKKIEDAIKIIIEISGNDISFTCRNYYDNSKSFTQEKSGLGIDLIKQRLNLLYNQKHQLDIIKTEDQFEVILKIVTK